LLRQRLDLRAASSPRDGVDELHRRASQWYEDNALEIEAFHHAAAANDIARVERLIEGKGVPLHFRGAGAPVLTWLQSLPTTVLDASPSLLVTYASALMMTGQHTTVEQKLQAAEAALAQRAPGAEPDDTSRDLVGRIASMRATVAVIQHDVDTLLAQSRRALLYLHPDNLPLRAAATYTLGYAYQLQGDRAAASQAYTDAIASSQSFGASIYTTAATLCLGQVQEVDNQLHLAVETYGCALLLAGDPPQPIACTAHLGLARISYQWNDLQAAEQHGEQCVQLMRQMERVDTFASYGVFLARLRLARGDVAGAVAILNEAEAFVRQHTFVFRMPDVAAAQVLTLLRQGHLAAAAHLAETHDLPISQARVYLAQGDTSAALAVLKSVRQQMEAKGWQDEQLQVIVLQAVASQAHGDMDTAVHLLGEALTLAEPGGFIRLFVDEGPPMAALLREVAKHETTPAYVRQVRAAFGEADDRMHSTQRLSEPLSERERDVLRLLRTELTGPEIASGLMVSLNTMRTHTNNIYAKLGVNNRRAAVHRAEELQLV
jgi:LuxR family maltose regulon positive regulatory protein